MCNSKMLGQLAVLPRICQLTGMLNITFLEGWTIHTCDHFELFPWTILKVHAAWVQYHGIYHEILTHFITHRIHVTGIFTYQFTLKINHSWRQICQSHGSYRYCYIVNEHGGKKLNHFFLRKIPKLDGLDTVSPVKHTWMSQEGSKWLVNGL